MIGLMAAAGAIFVARKILAPKAEQVFYAMFLIMIAAFYLAFAAYFSAFEPGQLTPIPLAYGVFCAAFDFCMAAYFYARRAEWIAAWKAAPQ